MKKGITREFTKEKQHDCKQNNIDYQHFIPNLFANLFAVCLQFADIAKRYLCKNNASFANPCIPYTLCKQKYPYIIHFL